MQDGKLGEVKKKVLSRVNANKMHILTQNFCVLFEYIIQEGNPDMISDNFRSCINSSTLLNTLKELLTIATSLLAMVKETSKILLGELSSFLTLLRI